MILKLNMVAPGTECLEQDGVEAVASATLACLRRPVPPAIDGIDFQFGRQSEELGSADLSAINIAHGSSVDQTTWPLLVLFGYSLQQPEMQIWRGQDANVHAASAL